MAKYLGGASVREDGKLTKFTSPFLITIRAFSKYWRLSVSESNDAQLVFRPTARKFKGGGGYLKQWRLRTNTPKPNGIHQQWTQKQTADYFNVRQSFISAIEAGEKYIPHYMHKVIFGAKMTMEPEEKENEEAKKWLRKRIAARKPRPRRRKQPKPK